MPDTNIDHRGGMRIRRAFEGLGAFWEVEHIRGRVSGSCAN
jgi:hypothetical protein